METAIRPRGSTAERYATVLERNVSAVSASGQAQGTVDPHAHSAFPRLTVADVMTTGMITAYEVARALHRNGINGVVTLSGRVGTALTARGLAHLASVVAGALDVRGRLEFDVKDVYFPARR